MPSHPFNSTVFSSHKNYRYLRKNPICITITVSTLTVDRAVCARAHWSLSKWKALITNTITVRGNVFTGVSTATPTHWLLPMHSMPRTFLLRREENTTERDENCHPEDRQWSLTSTAPAAGVVKNSTNSRRVLGEYSSFTVKDQSVPQREKTSNYPPPPSFSNLVLLISNV